MNKSCFFFLGTRGNCGNHEPHVPHVYSHYDTERYGPLENFCLGKEGPVENGELIIVVTRCSPGDASPGYAKGYWLVK